MKKGKLKKWLCVISLFVLTHVALATLVVYTMPNRIISQISESVSAKVAIAVIVLFASMLMWITSFCLSRHFCVRNNVDKKELNKYLMCLMWVWGLVGMLVSMWIYVACYDYEISLALGRMVHLIVTGVDFALCGWAIEIWVGEGVS